MTYRVKTSDVDVSVTAGAASATEKAPRKSSSKPSRSDAATSEDHKQNLMKHAFIGRSCFVKISSVSRWHAEGTILVVLDQHESRPEPPSLTTKFLLTRNTPRLDVLWSSFAMIASS